MAKKQEPEFIDELTEDVEKYIKKLKSKFKKTQKDAKEYLDGWQRERANFANYKKDIEKYIEIARDSAKEEVLFYTLSMMDNLELMLAHADKAIKKSDWFRGVEQAHRHAEQTISGLGVGEIPVKKGDKFDPKLHDAIEGDGDTIVKVLKKGYKMGDKVLRPVQVKVKNKK